MLDDEDSEVGADADVETGVEGAIIDAGTAVADGEDADAEEAPEVGAGGEVKGAMEGKRGGVEGTVEDTTVATTGMAAAATAAFDVGGVTGGDGDVDFRFLPTALLGGGVIGAVAFDVAPPVSAE